MASSRHSLSLHGEHVLHADSADPETAAEQDRLSHEQPIRVLFISDLLLVRAGLGHLLKASGIVVVGEATTCGEAVDLARSESPDIILLDLDSRSDAFTCVRDLISASEGSRVIALSDPARAADHPALVELGAVGMVMKHERPEILIKAIQKVHAGELWLHRADTARVLSRMTRRRHTEDLEASKIAALTKREHDIIALVGEGLKNAPIALRLFISEATARNHLTSILDKLDLSDRFELAVYAFRHGLVRYPNSQPPKPPTKA